MFFTKKCNYFSQATRWNQSFLSQSPLKGCFGTLKLTDGIYWHWLYLKICVLMNLWNHWSHCHLSLLSKICINIKRKCRKNSFYFLSIGSEPACFQKETKLEGTKLNRRPRIGEEFSIDNCQLLCKETLNCISWTLIGGKLPDCLLFSEVMNVTNQRNATSGPRVCSGYQKSFENEITPEEPSCILKSTAIRGDKVGENFPSTSLDNCQSNCQTSNKCNFWTFFKSEKTCALFSTVKRKVSRRGAKSGPRNCSEVKAVNQIFQIRKNGISF